MIKRLRQALSLSLLFLLVALITHGQGNRTGSARSAAAKHVIMISIDGLVPDYYTAPERAGLQTPSLGMLKSGGAYAEGVEGVYPSVTYPSHTTLVTGARPAVHGIVQNRIFEAPTETPTRAWYWFARAIKTETLWTAAKKAGLVTAAVGWPVTVNAEIDYNVPEVWDPAEQVPTGKRMAELATPGLLEQVFGAEGVKGSWSDDRRTTVSEYIIKTYRPNLMLIHLIELDNAHHRYGPRAPEAIKAAERQDSYIGRIIAATRQAGIFEQTAFFIVSDHGFASVNKRFRPNVVLVKEKLITLDASGKPIEWKAVAWPAGGSCAIMLRDAKDQKTAAQVRKIFSSLAARSDSPIKQVLTRRALRQLGAVPEAVLMLEAASGYSFDEALTGPEVEESSETYRGTHGHLPTRPEMYASLVIYGAGVRAGASKPLVRMIDIAPTAATLLNLKLPQAEGKPITEFLLTPTSKPTGSR